MLDYRSPTKADYVRHPHHHRFSARREDPAFSSPTRHGSASASSSPMPGASSSLVQHFQARSLSVSTPPPPPAGMEQHPFRPRVLDDVFGAAAAAAHEDDDDDDGLLRTPSGPSSSSQRRSWLSSATPHQQSFPTTAATRRLSKERPPTLATSFLHTPVAGQPLFSPFDPFAASSSSAPKSAGESIGGGRSPMTPSTAYIESLTHHRGSFIRSLSSRSAASTSSSFSASEPHPEHLLVDFPTPPTQPVVSPSGESLADVTSYYFEADDGANDEDDGADEDDFGEEMMTESDTTESDARPSHFMSPTRTERSAYAEQLREYTLSMMRSIAPSSPAVASPVKKAAAALGAGHQRRTSVASDGSLSGVGMRRAQGARENVFRNVAIYQPQEEQ